MKKPAGSAAPADGKPKPICRRLQGDSPERAAAGAGSAFARVFFQRSRQRRKAAFFRAFFSPLSTLVTHKILGSQFLQKRILDAPVRVAFY
jgi:hypothetical protein